MKTPIRIMSAAHATLLYTGLVAGGAGWSKDYPEATAEAKTVEQRASPARAAPVAPETGRVGLSASEVYELLQNAALHRPDRLGS